MGRRQERIPTPGLTASTIAKAASHGLRRSCSTGSRSLYSKGDAALFDNSGSVRRFRLTAGLPVVQARDFLLHAIITTPKALST